MFTLYWIRKHAAIDYILQTAVIFSLCNAWTKRGDFFTLFFDTAQTSVNIWTSIVYQTKVWKEPLYATSFVMKSPPSKSYKKSSYTRARNSAKANSGTMFYNKIDVSACIDIIYYHSAEAFLILLQGCYSLAFQTWNHLPRYSVLHM